jgi:hypothetical protein
VKLNTYFWEAAERLLDPSASYDVSELRRQLALYPKHVELAETESAKTPHIMTPRFRSEELVATWVSFCWAFRVAEEAHPILKSFGSALDPADLQFVILADRRARAAADLVRTFLEVRFAQDCKPFRRVSDTLKFARCFGRLSKDMCLVYEEEIVEANRLIQERWEKIQATQADLKDLLSQKIVAARDLNFAVQKLQKSRTHGDTLYRALQKAQQAAKATLSVSKLVLEILKRSHLMSTLAFLEIGMRR